MESTRSFVLGRAWVLGVGACMLLAAACASSAGADLGSGSTPACVGPGCPGIVEDAGGTGGAPTTVDVAIPEAGSQESDGGPSRNPLCATGCDPDDVLATDCASDAGEPSPVPLDGGTGLPAASLGCRVQRAAAGGAEAVCAAAGLAANGACVSAADCPAGFACVGDAWGAGRCQPYCCAGMDACEAGTYCAERPLIEPGATRDLAPINVPVCVAGDNCSLLAPYPCTANQQGASCPCPEATACAVVRADATTACVPPGTGETGEACPCAPGFVCSESTSTCLRLCQTATGGLTCEEGRCQRSSALPEGFGVCTLETASMR